MDAVASFAHLTTNLPDWISQIDKLSAHATQKHDEFAAEYTWLLKSVRPKRIKSQSITSIHSTDQAPFQSLQPSPADADTTPQSPDFPEISPFEAGNRYLYAQARRKRKPTSSLRSGASGPQKFRSKHSVIIYYDGFLQEQLDTMVKNIASARNNVRKGKMSRLLQKGLQLPVFIRRFPDAYHSSTEDLGSPQMRSSKSLPTDSKTAAAVVKSQADDGCFCQADKDLENAQSLCETAAHQFLRDGDCKLELEGVKAKLETVLVLATDSVAKFQAEKDAEKEQDEACTASGATLCEKPSDEVISVKMGPFMNHFAPSLSQHPGAGAAEIEVDDDDGSSIDVDITKFRSTRAAGARSGLRA